MKKFTLSLIAALLAVISYAQAPAAKAVRTLMPASNTGQLLQNAGRIDEQRTIPMGALKAPRKAAEDYVVITEQPEGELKSYVRGGNRYVVSGSSLSYGAQTGSIDIVFATDNKVYFKDIVSGLAYGTWVEGTLSEDETTITVPLGQNLRYVSNYDACIALRMLQFDNA